MGASRSRRTWWILLLLLPLGGGGVLAQEADPPLEAGFGIVDLTPDEPVPLGGYGARLGRASTGVHDPVKARAMVLRRGGASVALVSLDLVGVSRRVRELVTRRVADLALGDVVLTATHTHSGPGALTEVPLWKPAMGAFDPRLFVRTAARIEAAIRTAHADVTPARLALARGDPDRTRGLRRNRVWPGRPVAGGLGVLRVDAPDGRPRGVVVHFAAHATILPASLREISAGWPGALCTALERDLPGVTAIYFNGAMGDVSPVVPPASGGDDAYARMTAYGEAVARATLDAYRHAERVVDPGADPVDADRLVVHGTTEVPALTVADHLLGGDTPHALVPETPWSLPVARLDLGSLEIVTVPGEPVQAVGAALGAGPTRWIVSCAQDHLGYFADRELYRRGDAYEGDLSLFGPDAADRLARVANGEPPLQVMRPRPETRDLPPTPIRIAPAGDRHRGSAYALGWGHGQRLGGAVQDLLRDAEGQLADMLVKHGGGILLAPASLATGLSARRLTMPVLVRAARRLQRHIPPAYLDEMEGLAAAAGVPYDAILLENVFLTLAEQPKRLSLITLPARCTNVVALGDATQLGQVLHGSTLDWGMHAVLKDRTVPLVMEPEDGHPFVSVTWPGMVGTLRAMGAQALAITEESCAAPEDTTLDGLPVNLLMRQVVQHADGLDEAVRMVEEAPGTCGYKITISDGRALDARVVEVTARRHQVRRPVAGLLFGCDPEAPPESFVGGDRDPSIPPNDGSSARRYPVVRRLLEAGRQRLRPPHVEAALATPEGGVLNGGTLLACLFEPGDLAFHLALREDVAPAEERLGWRTYDLFEHLAPARRAAYRPPWPVTSAGDVTSRVHVENLAGLRIEHVTFTSPVRSGVAGNDVVRAELFTPRDPLGVVIQLPHWKEPAGGAGQRLVSLLLTRKRLAVLLLPLPYQYGRTPQGARTGEWTLSHDLARTREAALQGAADVARVSLWLEQERGFPPARQGILGTSLGGHVASLAYGSYPDRFAAGAFLLTGSHVGQAMLRKNGVTDGIVRRLRARGVTGEDVAAFMAPIDPARHARPDLKDAVVLVAGTEDPVVPRESAEALARAWGGAEVLWYEGGHYEVIRHAGTVLAAVVDHFRDRFEAR